jgi:hypothetical protein
VIRVEQTGQNIRWIRPSRPTRSVPSLGRIDSGPTDQPRRIGAG